MDEPSCHAVPSGTEVLFRRDPPAPADLNMALDDELLWSLDPDRPAIAVRFYLWERPSISLGRFQDPAGLVDLKKLADDGVALVRRRTGGRGVYHPAGEAGLTCAMAVTPATFRPFDHRTVFRVLHGLFAAALARLGIPSVVVSRGGRLVRPSGNRLDCFDAVSELELAGPDGSKLMGSAQVRGRRGILQQTAIPLGPEVRRLGRYALGGGAPTGGVSPLFGLEADRLIEGFLEVLERACGTAPRPWSPDPRRVGRLRRFYQDPDWTFQAIPPQGADPWPSL